MHTLLFADSTQTFPVSQDKIGISVFNFSPFHIYSLDLWFPNGLILEKKHQEVHKHAANHNILGCWKLQTLLVITFTSK